MASINSSSINNLPRIIAICGRKRSGKDSVAGYLSEHYGYVNAKFADPLKQAVKGFFGFTEHQVEVDKEVVDELWGITPRHAMQFIGCHIVQHEFQKLIPDIGRDFFIKSLLCKHKNTERVVISDLRFAHEFDAINAIEGSIIIKLTRPDIDNSDTHISEIEVDNIKCEYEIVNDGTLEDLWEKIETIMKTISM